MNHISRGGGEPLGLFRAPHGPSCSHRAKSHCSSDSKIYRMGTNLLSFWAQLLVVQSGAPWQFIATVQLWGPGLWCRAGQCLLQAPGEFGSGHSLAHSTIPVQSLTAVILRSCGIPISYLTLFPVQFHLPLGSRFKTSGRAWTQFVDNQALSINSTQIQTYPQYPTSELESSIIILEKTNVPWL